MSLPGVADISDHDGRTYPGHRDPPGQASIYIQPGDERKESYRLYTLQQFPQSSVGLAELARSGFHYTGFSDRVRCFSCGLCVENWIVGDDPTDPRWHRTDCDFANGNDTTNVPLQRVFSAFRASLARENSTGRSANVAAAGSRNSGNSGSGVPSARQAVYPCLAPVNPHMQSLVRRLESFSPRNGMRWPAQRHRASVDAIAGAGFFFLGERDRVKCWYCNGGLQNWDYDDEPWTEHAKWFPSCEFLLRVKGLDFVQAIVSQFPNLCRPAPIRKSPPSIPASSPHLAQTRPNCPAATRPGNVENVIRNFPYFALAQDMGFNKEVIEEILKRKYEVTGQLYPAAQEFINDLVCHQTRPVGSSSTPPPAVSRNTRIKEHEVETGRSSLQELRRLENERLCKICRREKSDIVFVPCGHIAICSGCCSGDVTHCPVCGRRIQDTIKAFRA